MANGKSYEEGGGSLDLYVSMIGSFLTPKAQGERGILTGSHHKPPQKRGGICDGRKRMNQGACTTAID